MEEQLLKIEREAIRLRAAEVRLRHLRLVAEERAFGLERPRVLPVEAPPVGPRFGAVETARSARPVEKIEHSGHAARELADVQAARPRRWHPGAEQFGVAPRALARRVRQATYLGAYHARRLRRKQRQRPAPQRSGSACATTSVSLMRTTACAGSAARRSGSARRSCPQRSRISAALGRPDPSRAPSPAAGGRRARARRVILSARLWYARMMKSASRGGQPRGSAPRARRRRLRPAVAAVGGLLAGVLRPEIERRTRPCAVRLRRERIAGNLAALLELQLQTVWRAPARPRATAPLAQWVVLWHLSSRRRSPRGRGSAPLRSNALRRERAALVHVEPAARGSPTQPTTCVARASRIASDAFTASRSRAPSRRSSSPHTAPSRAVASIFGRASEHLRFYSATRLPAQLCQGQIRRHRAQHHGRPVLPPRRRRSMLRYALPAGVAAVLALQLITLLPSLRPASAAAARALRDGVHGATQSMARWLLPRGSRPRTIVAWSGADDPGVVHLRAALSTTNAQQLAARRRTSAARSSTASASCSASGGRRGPRTGTLLHARPLLARAEHQLLRRRCALRRVGARDGRVVERVGAAAMFLSFQFYHVPDRGTWRSGTRGLTGVSSVHKSLIPWVL